MRNISILFYLMWTCDKSDKNDKILMHRQLTYF